MMKQKSKAIKNFQALDNSYEELDRKDNKVS